MNEFRQDATLIRGQDEEAVRTSCQSDPALLRCDSFGGCWVECRRGNLLFYADGFAAPVDYLPHLLAWAIQITACSPCRRNTCRARRPADRPGSTTPITGRLVVPPVVRMVSRVDMPGTATMLAVMLAFGLAWLASALGSAMIIGAFAAGLLLRDTPQAHEIERGVAHLGHLFVPLFFVTVGHSG